jgi:hypothetical protein
MKATNTRRPLHQQGLAEQKGPFFNKGNDDAKKKDDVFFQTKLAVGEKDDKHEKEADQVADKVQKKTEEKEKPDVQKKGEDKDKEADKGTAGQAPAALPAAGPKSAAEPAADKDKMPAGSKEATGGHVKHGKDPAAERPAATAAGQAAAAENKDKAPDPKSAAGPAAQAGKDKEPAKGAAQQMTPKEEDSKMISRKEAEQDKEPAVQKMNDGDKKDEDKTKVNKQEIANGGDTVSVMREEAPKPAPAPVHAGAHKVSLEERIKKSKGKGQSLPDEVKSFLEAELGADFSEVVIHTDSEAVAMNKELNALAFTNGFDIYFNAGQYRPDSKAGQKLLAHELTHVIQQTGVSKAKKVKGK